MTTPKVDLVSGEPWTPNVPAILVVGIESNCSPANQLNMTIGITLRRYPVRMGRFIKREYYIACTGIFVQVWAKEGELSFFDYTRSATVKVDFELKHSRARGAEIDPKMELKAKGAEGKVELLKLRRESGSERTAKFSLLEAPLVAIQPAAGVIEWSIDRPRVESIVRDFLEGSVDLEAKGRWNGDRPPVVRVVARPRDRRVFGPNLRALGLLWSLGIMAKLKYKGKLPSVEEVQQEVRV